MSVEEEEKALLQQRGLVPGREQKAYPFFLNCEPSRVRFRWNLK